MVGGRNIRKRSFDECKRGGRHCRVLDVFVGIVERWVFHSINPAWFVESSQTDTTEPKVCVGGFGLSELLRRMAVSSIHSRLARWTLFGNVLLCIEESVCCNSSLHHWCA